MKIEMPKEPDVDRLWTNPLPDDHHEGSWVKWQRIDGPEHEGAHWEQVLDGDAHATWRDLRGHYDLIYTTHPDLAALEKYPTPWSTSASGGTVRAKNGKVVLDPTLQCPPCLTALLVRAVNELAERNTAASSLQTEGEKK